MDDDSPFRIMTYLKAAFLGIIQGLTEFLPISSSAHLVICQKLLAITETPVVFDLMLHMGTLVAIFIVFYKDIVHLLKTIPPFLRTFVKGGTAAFIRHNENGRLLYLIIVTTAVTGLLGLVFKDTITRTFHNTRLVGLMLVITGCFLLGTVLVSARRQTSRQIVIGDALVIGMVQALALLPGISRSGVTIAVGMMLGISRLESMRYSFLIAIPAIIGAWLIESAGYLSNGPLPYGIAGPLLLGTAVSAAVGYGALRILRTMLQRGTFRLFMYYCWAVGILTMLF